MPNIHKLARITYRLNVIDIWSWLTVRTVRLLFRHRDTSDKWRPNNTESFHFCFWTGGKYVVGALLSLDQQVSVLWHYYILIESVLGHYDLLCVQQEVKIIVASLLGFQKILEYIIQQIMYLIQNMLLWCSSVPYFGDWKRKEFNNLKGLFVSCFK